MKKKTKVMTIAIIISLILFSCSSYLKSFYNVNKEGNDFYVIHFSVDDTINIFKDLTENNYDSIFNNDLLYFLKKCHDKYGMKVCMYCYYEDKNFNLSMVPDNYKSEFIENFDWLKFGFHCKNGNEPTDSAAQIIEDYKQFTSELARITGGGYAKL